MQHLMGKTAVVTGAASGLGLAMAGAFCREGMRVVLADLPSPALTEAAHSLSDKGFAVLGVAVDVADAASVDALARRSIEHFGRVDVLCNNAGIAGDLPRESWEHDLANWRRVLDVNLMGVIHGIHSFIPLMLGQPDGHVINTASMGGLVALPYLAPYAASKAALIALSESLELELNALGANISVSVLCPGMVQTGLTRPGMDHSVCTAAPPSAPAQEFYQGTQKSAVQATVSADDVARKAIEGMRNGQFFILSHGGTLATAQKRWQRLQGNFTLQQEPQA
ncbi:MAG TPA: SDR family NAD(P)-dependent oxidoreductase [Pseudomonas xinjiangensis]|uniref:SDR family NAD(P)-dependent oxidoreductase n=2 Tax=root TaxID=1 RepID=A0A7V1BR39_9GAMM|nr:SDR family NAD(P)-dependent oxidoreductase [Halopseudomonas xinjiangensis]HEC47361.1 SDR family NAD(P)-dependent oxidoreductase [Halopseudomonas xinjiangensis]